MFKIAICDDEKMDLDLIAAAVEHAMHETLVTFGIERYESAQALTDAYQSGARWDALFLDILLDGVNGVALGADLRELGCEAQIVFVTVASEFALDAYRVFPAGYLVKPINEGQLSSIVRHLLSETPQWGLLTLRDSEGGAVVVSCGEIRLIEIYGRELVTHMRNGQKLNCLGTMNDVCKGLPQPFFRCHRCYTVNMACVRRIERYQFRMDDGTTVPISQRGFSKARARMLDYHRVGDVGRLSTVSTT